MEKGKWADDEEINKRFEELFHPSLEEFKGELQYDAKVWLTERESDVALRGPFDLIFAFALICARHVTAILISSRSLKNLSASGRASFTERFLLCSSLYVLSAVHRRLRNLPGDDWDHWPVVRGSCCFEARELSTLFALDVFCTELEINSFEWIFRFIWNITGRPVDCDPVLNVIENTVTDAGLLNFIQWSHRFNLNIFMCSELFPGSGDVCFPKIISDECNLEVELERVMLELQHEYCEATANLIKPIDGDDTSNTYSKDFRSVTWYGKTYSFNKSQAIAIKLLWKAMEKNEGIHQNTIAESLGTFSKSYRLLDTFRQHGRIDPAWSEMIDYLGNGIYTLKKPR